MSQIDEAFIQAYAPPQVDSPQASSPQQAGQPNAPHIQLHAPVQPPMPASVPAPNPSVAWAPEPIPAPHFVAAPAQTVEAAAPAGPATERRPLSTFSAPEQPATTAFNPVFEVDGFRWPKITDDLLSAHHQLLVPVAEQLLDVSEQGRSLIGIVGTRPNVGCSTVLMCLARLVASVGKSVALVDANFAKAALARDLGLEFDMGWQDVLTGDLPLAECVVKSLKDRIALLPLARQTGAATELLASIQTSVTAGVLRYHYDVVLFNLGNAAEPPQDEAAFSIMQHCRLDASIIVADTERTGIEPVDTLLSLFGQKCLGVIGNSAT
ncbi:MAG: hypothetical protein GXP24_06865 [Planctomycetes bacterium]|nr:hypothetical protein [Planctomycetota bacterium]